MGPRLSEPDVSPLMISPQAMLPKVLPPTWSTSLRYPCSSVCRKWSRGMICWLSVSGGRGQAASRASSCGTRTWGSTTTMLGVSWNCSSNSGAPVACTMSLRMILHMVHPIEVYSTSHTIEQHVPHN